MGSFLVHTITVWTKKERWEPELGAGYPFKNPNSYGHFALASFTLLDDVTIVPPNRRIGRATSAQAMSPWESRKTERQL